MQIQPQPDDSRSLLAFETAWWTLWSKTEEPKFGYADTSRDGVGNDLQIWKFLWTILGTSTRIVNVGDAIECQLQTGLKILQEATRKKRKKSK